MHEEMSTVINRLQTLPLAEQQALAPKIASYIDEVEHYRELIQEGLQSGDSKPLTHDVFRNVIARGQERHTQHS